MTAYLKLLSRLFHVVWIVGAGCFLARWGTWRGDLDQETILQAMLFMGIATAIVFQATGLYEKSVFDRKLNLWFIGQAWSLTLFLVFLVRPMVPVLARLTTAQLIQWHLMALLLMCTQRVVASFLLRHLVRKGVGFQNMVILGRTEGGSRLAEFLQENGDIRSRVIGFIDDRHRKSSYPMAGLEHLGSTDDLLRLVREGKVDQILIALPWSAGQRVANLVRKLRPLPVNLLMAPDMVAFHHAHNRITTIAGLHMFNISDLPLRGWSPLIKRIEDVMLASASLLLALPVMVAVAVAIKLDSRGPVLFRQKRYGYNNQLIEVWKFRSMRTDMADAHAAQQTTREDPRVTRVGRFIRKTSLDELPQLLNVLGGSMSLIGPRPHAMATKAAGVLFEDAVDEYTSRHRVKPGITGWAQINGYRGETDTLEKIEKRVAYDLAYIENWSLWFDLYILVRTPLAVMSARGAY